MAERKVPFPEIPDLELFAFLHFRADAVRAMLGEKYPEAAGFRITGDAREGIAGPEPKVSYFRPWSVFRHWDSKEQAKDRLKYAVYKGLTTGMEVEVSRDPKSPVGEFLVKTGWTSVVYERMLGGAVVLVLLVMLVALSGFAIDQCGSGRPSLILVLPWKLLWGAIILFFAVSIPLAALVFLIAKLVCFFGPAHFTGAEQEEVADRVAGLLVAPRVDRERAARLLEGQ